MPSSPALLVGVDAIEIRVRGVARVVGKSMDLGTVVVSMKEVMEEVSAAHNSDHQNKESRVRRYRRCYPLLKEESDGHEIVIGNVDISISLKKTLPERSEEDTASNLSSLDSEDSFLPDSDEKNEDDEGDDDDDDENGDGGGCKLDEEDKAIPVGGEGGGAGTPHVVLSLADLSQSK